MLIGCDYHPGFQQIDGCFGLMKSEPPLHTVEVRTLAKIARMGQPPPLSPEIKSLAWMARPRRRKWSNQFSSP